MNDILLLTDFSELSGYAKSLADKVAFHSGARLHILKIVDVPSEIEINLKGEVLGGMADDISSVTEEKNTSEVNMRDWVKDLKSNFITSVYYGRLQESIKKYINENNIELVIMGTHGVSGMRELLSGSVTEHIIMNNAVPVLSLKCDRETIDFSDFLITGDFDSQASMNLNVLKALQQVFQTTLHLLWVNTKKHFVTTTEAMGKMTAFAQKNQLQSVEYHIYNDNSFEEGVVNFSNNYDASHSLDIDIIAVEKKEKSQLGYILTGCQATSFVNHIFRPIVTYIKA